MRGSRKSVSKVRSGMLVLAAVLAARQAAQAGDGNWSLNGVGNYADPVNWLGGIVADDGGIATFGPVLSANGGVVVDGTPRLSKLVFDADFPYLMVGLGSLDLGGGIIHTPRVTPDSSLILVSNAVITVPIVGSGGLTKTGPGTLMLSNTASGYTGPTSILAGTLQVAAGSGGLSQDGLVISNAALRILNQPVTYNGPVSISGNARFEALAQLTLNGVVSGPGNFVRTLGGDNITPTAVRLNASNQFTGDTLVRGNLLQLGNADGSIRGSQRVDLAGQLAVISTDGVNSDRFHPSAVVTSRGSRLTFGHSNSTDTLHNLPNLTLESGRTEIITTSNAATTNTVSVGTLTRNERSQLMLRGFNGSSTRVLVGTSLPMVGGTGGPGTTSRPIIPWITANPSSTLFIPNATFVTRDAATGEILPLNLTNDFASSLATAGPTDNVRLIPSVAGTLAVSGTTINSLIVANMAGVTGLILSGNAPLNIVSGAILHSPNNSLARTTFDVPINFGAAEGILHASSGSFVTINRPMSGSNGVTFANFGQTAFNPSASSNYTGTTTILGGTLQYNSNILSNTDGPFGNSSTPIILSGNSYPSGTGAGPSLLMGSNGLTFSRPLIVRGGALQPASLGTVTSSFELRSTVNSTISLEGGDLGVNLNGGLHSITFNGEISGTGRLFLSSPTAANVILGASNSYSGGTETVNVAMYARSDNAFGSGPILFSNTGTLTALSRIAGFPSDFGTQRTIPNSLVLRNHMTVLSGATMTFTGSVDLGFGNGGTGGVPYNIDTSTPTTFTGRLFNGGVVKTGTSTLTLAGTNAYTGPTIVRAGRLNAETPVRPGVGLLSVTATGSVAAFAAVPSAAPVVVGEFSRIDINTGGLASVAYTGRTTAAPRVLVTGGLLLASGGRLNLTNNDLIVRATNAATGLSSVRGHVASTALFSSVAGSGVGTVAATGTADPRDAFGALGVLGNTDDFGVVRFTAFDGVPLAAADVIVKYTYVGDTDLDGELDGNDLANLLEGFSTGATGWDNGDFNYDGAVTPADFALFLPAYQAYAAGTLQPFSQGTGTGSAIPETTSLALLLPAAALLNRRRR